VGQVQPLVRLDRRAATGGTASEERRVDLVLPRFVELAEVAGSEKVTRILRECKTKATVRMVASTKNTRFQRPTSIPWRFFWFGPSSQKHSQLFSQCIGLRQVHESQCVWRKDWGNTRPVAASQSSEHGNGMSANLPRHQMRVRTTQLINSFFSRQTVSRRRSS